MQGSRGAGTVLEVGVARSKLAVLDVGVGMSKGSIIEVGVARSRGAGTEDMGGVSDGGLKTGGVWTEGEDIDVISSSAEATPSTCLLSSSTRSLGVDDRECFSFFFNRRNENIDFSADAPKLSLGESSTSWSLEALDPRLSDLSGAPSNPEGGGRIRLPLLLPRPPLAAARAAVVEGSS